MWAKLEFLKLLILKVFRFFFFRKDHLILNVALRIIESRSYEETREFVWDSRAGASTQVGLAPQNSHGSLRSVLFHCELLYYM